MPSFQADTSSPTAARSGDAPPEAAGTRIGIFDSGVGGLSILQAIGAELPGADLLYVADTGHAPYGDRSEAFVCDRSLRIAGFLRDQGAEVIVVACNTATAAAVAALRERWPGLAIVGVEPGIKPAIALSASKRVGVLATTGTLASEKFRRLAAMLAADAELVLQACPGLADAIEVEDADDDRVPVLVECYCEPLRTAGVDVAVLGCTHYVFARDHFARALPDVALLDTAQAVARQVLRLAPPRERAGPADAPMASSPGSPGTLSGRQDRSGSAWAPASVRAWSSGDPSILSQFALRRLGLALTVEQLGD